MTMALLQIAVLLFFWIASTTGSRAVELSGQVRNVIDGDDFELCAVTGSCTRIRLCGVDAPERECPGYSEAREALRALVEGKPVRCIQVGTGTPCDGRSAPKNRERTIAQCFVDDIDVAGSLVERGLACDWERYSGGHYSRNGKGRPCPPNHRRACTAVSPRP